MHILLLLDKQFLSVNYIQLNDGIVEFNYVLNDFSASSNYPLLIKGC